MFDGLTDGLAKLHPAEQHGLKRTAQIGCGLIAIVLVVVTLLYGKTIFHRDTPEERVMRDIARVAGDNTAPKDAGIKWLTYDPPIPKGATYKKVGNARVYYKALPDLTFVERPTFGHGVQTLMYLHSARAANTALTFNYRLLPGTKLRKADNGTVGVYDTQTKLTVPMLSEPWARSLHGDIKKHPTDFIVKGSRVTQTADLRYARYPVIMDPQFDDPLTQLLEGRVARPEDGKPVVSTYGRYYQGINGLEIRLNSRGTQMIAAEAKKGLGKGIDKATGALGAAGVIVMKKSVPAGLALLLLATTGEVSDAFIDDLYSNVVVGDKCLGVTIPPGFEPALMKGVAYLSLGNYIEAFNSISQNSASIWVEHCTHEASSEKSLIQAPKLPPPPKQEEKTQPIKPSVSVPHKAPVPEGALSHRSPQNGGNTDKHANSPVYHDHDLVVEDACSKRYGYAKARYTDWNRSDSWVCQDGSGHDVGPVWLQEDYCDIKYPGSAAVPIEENAYGWKCRSS